jgi:signal transduction histidine kinase/CheY-like chemotaxis protein/HPt (histidine-containing phosphotransfer) domain-containing protein
MRSRLRFALAGRKDRSRALSLGRTAFPFAFLVSVAVAAEAASALQAWLNFFATFGLLAGCILFLSRSDKARREREFAIAQSESQYRHAEQVGHIGHWQLEFPSGAVEWSDEFYAICGLANAAVPSLEATMALFHPDDAVVGREIVARSIKDGCGWELGHRICRPSGEIRHIKSHGVCDRDAGGKIVAIFGVIVDVTELELSRREAEAATASKAAFLANMSHEIRTPMSGVMGFVELLMDSDLDTGQRRHLLLIQESAQALLKLLNDILDLSKIEAGQLEVSSEPSDVRRDIAQCVRLMTPIAEQKGLELLTDIEGDFPARVMVDSLRLRQIVFNLLGNAVKFTNRGSVSVTLRAGHDAGQLPTMLIGVRDTGVGIAPERKAAIFEAFVQADVSISRHFGGSGLGLSISRRLARLMGGTIALESAEGEGTRVTLALPLQPAQGASLLEERRAPRNDPVAEACAPRMRASILLVEDMDINRELICEMLDRLGHKVDLAANGAEALEFARRLGAEPETWDLILMDVQMPVMDGLTATRAIRALGGRASTIPIVALTANAFAAEAQECLDAGMNDHVPKPSGFVQLKRAIDRWSGAGPAAAAPAVRSVAAPSLAERFEIRRRDSSQRLTELIVELGEADPAATKALLREAGRIAHVLAGTAGMFGQGRLGKIARQAEAEIKSVARAPSRKANPALDRLVAALDAPPRQPASPLPEHVV